MYAIGNKKTAVINKFKRTAVVKARDLYARYGERRSNNGILGTDSSTTGDVVPQGSAVIQSMISAQESLKKHVPNVDQDK